MDFNFFDGLMNALEPQNLAFALIGCVLGTAVGVLPGLGSASALALLLPMTFGVAPETGILMLAGVFYGCRYGGSTTAILMNIPGEESSIPTMFDGHPMAKDGRAGHALAIAAIGSFMAGCVGAAVVAILGPSLADVALRFGPPDYFALTLFGLVGVISVSSPRLLRGVVSAGAGIWLASIGIDGFTGAERLTFGTTQLIQGFEIVAVLIGIFGVGEVLASANERGATFNGKLPAWWRMIPTGEELKRGLRGSALGTAIGTVCGLVPGIGTGITAFMSYDAAKRVFHRRNLGTGAIEGVAAPEAANNGAAMTNLVPLLALGIPTGASVSVLLAAFFVYGVTPGPTMFSQNGELVWTLIAGMFVANGLLLALNLPLVKFWATLTKVPFSTLAPIILVVCVLGAYSVRNSLFDVWTTIGFGIVGLAMRRLDVPLSPLVLGFLLGPVLEKNLRQSLQLSQGSWDIFLLEPISLVFLILAGLVVVLAVGTRPRRRRAAEEVLETQA